MSNSKEHNNSLHWMFSGDTIMSGSEMGTNGKWPSKKKKTKKNRGLFEPTMMFFGMCNSPVTFQAMMDNIFRGMINNCIVIIYMDDIFLFAPGRKMLMENTKKVLTCLQTMIYS